jgi:predicted dehydrogenase
MTTPLRVAVVGAGGWGTQHARIFAGRADTDLVGVLGRNPDRTATRAEAFGTRPYTDLAIMLERERPDLVSVCLPNEDHYEQTLRLIEAGVALLVEKPLVFELDQADTLIDRAERSGIFFAINFNHRYAEPVVRAKAAIDAGDLGELNFLTWRFGGEPNLGASAHGNLIETQCHGFDLLEHLAGPIASLTAQFGPLVEGSHRDVVLTLAFDGGAIGTMVGSYGSSYAYPGAQLIEINGTLGRATIEDTVRRLTISRTGDDVARVWQAGYFDDEARSFHGTFDRHVDAVINALRTGAPPPVHATAGRRALRLAQAAISSNETGRRVEVPAG